MSASVLAIRPVRLVADETPVALAAGGGPGSPAPVRVHGLARHEGGASLLVAFRVPGAPGAASAAPAGVLGLRRTRAHRIARRERRCRLRSRTRLLPALRGPLPDP